MLANRQCVYMYHVVGNYTAGPMVDAHYAVSCEQFESHLKCISAANVLAQRDPSSGAGQFITFDDGHKSHYRDAFPALLRVGARAEFYVNTAAVGTVECVSWPQLREMQRHGMSIQSHSHTHVFLSDLEPTKIRHELEVSKKSIEDNLGCEVSVLAPPGGRYNRRVWSIARELGFRKLAISRPGILPYHESDIFPRFAVLAKTSAQRVLAWQNGMSAATLAVEVRYGCMAALKKILGNHYYTSVRDVLVRQRSGQ